MRWAWLNRPAVFLFFVSEFVVDLVVALHVFEAEKEEAGEGEGVGFGANGAGQWGGLIDAVEAEDVWAGFEVVYVEGAEGGGKAAHGEIDGAADVFPVEGGLVDAAEEAVEEDAAEAVAAVFFDFEVEFDAGFFVVWQVGDAGFVGHDEEGGGGAPGEVFGVDHGVGGDAVIEGGEFFGEGGGGGIGTRRRRS